MTKTDTAGDQNLRTLIDADLQDTLDEELEMELDDRRLEQLEGIRPAREMHEPMDRSHYFRELLRLQGELVKLQDWIQHNKLKVVVSSKAATPLARAASSSASPSDSIRASAGSPRCPRRASANGRNGIFSATSPTFRQAEKSCCSTVLGTIVPASSA